MLTCPKPLAVIILAAGKGTRMDSDLPKVLHKVNGKPMITQVVHLAKSIGADIIIAVVGHKYELVQNALENEPVEFAHQFEQKGTAHAVEQCRSNLANFQGNVLVLSGDVPLTKTETINSLLQAHQNGNAPSSILSTELPDPTGYGRIIRNPDDTLNKIVEEKDAHESEREIREINSGIYIFDCGELFRLLPQVGNNNKQNEYYLPDVLNLILTENGKVIIEKTPNYYEIQGVNTIEQLSELNRMYEEVS